MTSSTLTGSRILVVEDEYFLADDARTTLEDVGAEIVGPVATVDQANALILSDKQIDCVLLDVNLRGEMAFDVADTLQARDIPFAFVTGYDPATLPKRFISAPSMAKPFEAQQLVELCLQLTAVPRTF